MSLSPCACPQAASDPALFFPESENEILESFRAFDYQGSGTISISEFQTVMRNYGEALSVRFRFLLVVPPPTFSCLLSACCLLVPSTPAQSRLILARPVSVKLKYRIIRFLLLHSMFQRQDEEVDEILKVAASCEVQQGVIDYRRLTKMMCA
jgi:hypothetical protein